MSNSSNDRREFLKGTGVGLLTAFVGARILTQSLTAQAAAPPAVEVVKENDPTAQALGYKEDAKKVDVKKFPKRAGAEGAKQFCVNCQFFQGNNDPKAAKNMPCTIFGGKLVSPKGWCGSWTQNPAIKA